MLLSLQCALKSLGSPSAGRHILPREPKRFVYAPERSDSILHVTEALSGGGAEELVRALAPRLRTRGFRVGVVTVCSANLDQNDRDQLPITIYEVNKRDRIDLLAFPRLLRSIKTFSPDLIHAHTYAGKYWGRVAAALCRIPVIMTEHGAAYRDSQVERFVSHFLNRQTAAIVVFSDRTAKAVSGGSDKSMIRIIPNGVSFDLHYDRRSARDALGCGGEELAVVTVGSLRPEKAPQVALRAFGELPNNLLRRSRLHWLGAGPLMSEAQACVSKLGLEEGVIFHGYRSDARLLIAGADIALSSSAIEAAPLWLLEAMAAGVPVVGTPTLGVKDLVEHGRTGLIAPSHDPLALSRALALALSDERWRKAAALASKERAHKYDINSVADAYASLYHEVIDRSRSLARQ